MTSPNPRPPLRRRLERLAVVLLLAGCIASPVAAQEDEEASEREEFPSHQLAALIGRAVEKEDADRRYADYVLGLDYEYRFQKLLGVGGLLEFVGGDTVREAILVAQLNFHFYRGFRAAVAAGGEIDSDRHSAAVLRLALVYEFELGRGWTVGPDLAVDFVGDGRTVYVYGFGVGYRF